MVDYIREYSQDVKQSPSCLYELCFRIILWVLKDMFYWAGLVVCLVVAE